MNPLCSSALYHFLLFLSSCNVLSFSWCHAQICWIIWFVAISGEDHLSCHFDRSSSLTSLKHCGTVQCVIEPMTVRLFSAGLVFFASCLWPGLHWAALCCRSITLVALGTLPLWPMTVHHLGKSAHVFTRTLVTLKVPEHPLSVP